MLLFFALSRLYSFKQTSLFLVPLLSLPELEQVLADNDLISLMLFTRETFRQSMTDHFLILLFVLMALAVAALVVGGSGLATTMSLNVLERRRETGVIRSIGTAPKTVLWMFMSEGLRIAVWSIGLAVLISFPLSAFVGLVVRNHRQHSTLPIVVSFTAVLAWTILAVIIAILPGFFPALGSIRLSVRDVLGYE